MRKLLSISIMAILMLLTVGAMSASTNTIDTTDNIGFSDGIPISVSGIMLSVKKDVVITQLTEPRDLSNIKTMDVEGIKKLVKGKTVKAIDFILPCSHLNFWGTTPTCTGYNFSGEYDEMAGHVYIEMVQTCTYQGQNEADYYSCTNTMWVQMY